MGAAVGDYRQRRPRRPLRDRPRPEPPLPQPGQRHVRGRDAAGAAPTARAGARARPFFDYDRDGSSTSTSPTTSTSSRPETACFGLERPRLLRAEAYRPVPERLFHNRGDGTFEDVSEGSASRRARHGPRRRRRRLRRRRLARHLRGQRRRPELPLDEPARRHVPERCAAGGRRRERRWAARWPGWASTPATSTATAASTLRHEHHAETAALFVNEGNGLFDDRTIAAGLVAAAPWEDRLRHRLVRLGQRRLARPRRRERGRAQAPRAAPRRDRLPLRQSNVLFRNTGAGTFEDATASAGKAFSAPDVGRGLAFGDLDNDGGRTSSSRATRGRCGFS